jgi:hypothetical protein
VSIAATSASCGSFGSGVLSRDCRERRADLMVRTGDQAVPRVSRQMAPCCLLVSVWKAWRSTHSLTADIGMPELGLEEHLRRLEWIFLRNFDVYHICTSLIWGIWGTWESSDQMSDIRSFRWLCIYLRLDICLDVLQLLVHSSYAVGSHLGSEEAGCQVV